MWLVTHDGRAFNLDHFLRVEARNGSISLFTFDGLFAEISGFSAEVDVLDQLVKGQGVDLREQPTPGIQG